MGQRKNEKTDVFRFIDMRDGNTSVCWPWTGAVSGKWKDRPSFSIDGVKHVAYRIVYELYHGVEPGNSLVRHTCDNPLCCNPTHMELGDHSDNRNDDIKRDRVGLPVGAVRQIKRLHEDCPSFTHAQIAAYVGVQHGLRIARSTVSDILRGNRRSVAGQMTSEEVEAHRQGDGHVRLSRNEEQPSQSTDEDREQERDSTTD